MAEVKAVEWAEQVKKIFHGKKSLANADKVPRVAAPLLDAKPEAYIPHFVSMGPYHHSTLEKNVAASSFAGDSYEFRELKMSTVEAYKVQSAAKFLRNRSGSLDGIVKRIKEMQQKIEEFYDWKSGSDGEYAEHFSLLMAIDSCFLLDFLFSRSGPSSDGMKWLEVPIMCDILKLENQIPLSVLRDVFDYTKEASERFNDLLQKTYKKLSPFDQFDMANTDTKTQNNDQQHSIKISETQINDQPHLLGCVRAVISPLVHMEVIEEDKGPKLSLSQRVKYSLELIVAAIFRILRVKHPYQEGRLDILSSYNTAQMEKAGIHFKSFSSRSDKIRFDKYSATLYLPRITVSEVQTEVFFRNMLAYEFNGPPRGDSVTQDVGDSAASGNSATQSVSEAASRGNAVTLNVSPSGDSMTRYVGLMDCLIDTAEDVRLLRESQVIVRGSLMLTDQSIADMWNSMGHPILTGHLEPPDYLNSAVKEVLIRKYYMSIVKKVVWEFYWDHLSKPGNGVALLVGILLLAMDCAQTFFASRGWRDGTSKSSPHN